MIPENLKDLQQHQSLMVYEGIGHMVSTESPNEMPMAVRRLMSHIHISW